MTALVLAAFVAHAVAGETLPTIDDAATVSLPTRTVPWPAGVSEPAKQAYVAGMRSRLTQVAAAAGAEPVPLEKMLPAAIAYTQEQVKRQNARILTVYPAKVEERRIAGVRVQVVTPPIVRPENRDKVLINLHGGAFLFYAGSIYEAVPVAHFAQMPVIAVDYRMPPDHPFPAGLNDATDVFRELLKEYKPGNIGMFGTSAGAALTASTTLNLRKLGLPLPGAVGIISYGIGDTQETLEGLDPYLSRFGQPPMPIIGLYAPGRDPADPLITPSNGDFTPRFPPALLISGTRDLLLSGTVSLHRRMRNAGVEAELEIFEGMWHGFNANMNSEIDFPEAESASRLIADFFVRRLTSTAPRR